MLVKELNRDCSICKFKENGLCKSNVESNMDGFYTKGLCLSWEDDEDLDKLYDDALLKKAKKDELAAKRLEEKEFVAAENEQIKVLKAKKVQLENTCDLLIASTEILNIMGDNFSSLRQKESFSKLHDMQQEIKKLDMELSRVELQRKNKLKERRKALKIQQTINVELEVSE